MNEFSIKEHLYTTKTKFKSRFYICVILAAILFLTWAVFDNIHHSHTHVNHNKQTIFSDAEIDPATWSIQLREKEHVLTQNSLFPANAFAKENDRASPSITAVISRIQDGEGIFHVVDHLFKFPFIKEIHIHNSMKSSPLKPELFYNHTKRRDVHIEIIEAALFDMGKYTACAVASYSTCYFQDDLWLNPYLDSLYTHSQRYPDHFVVNTRPVNYLQYKKWRFTNQDIGLHAGYAEMRYGAFVSRQKVQRFLSQLSNQALDAMQLKYADIYFSIWLNQYPYLISNPLLSHGRDQFTSVDTINNRPLVEHYMYHALSLLERSLETSNSVLTENDDYFDTTEQMPQEIKERDIRSSCANDRCLFVTNIDVMPPVDETVKFNATRIANISDYNTVYDATVRAPLYAQDYYKAVDQNTDTCWNTMNPPKEGDYFGLYMTGDISAKQLILYTSNKLPNLEDLLQVTVQYRIFGNWESCEILNVALKDSLYYRIGFKCNQHQPMKSIRVTFQQDYDHQFELCSIGLDNFVV